MDLTQRDLASPEDIASGRLVWAELFRAKSWDELNQLAEKDTIAREVVDIMRTATKDDGISFAINEREIAEMDALSREKEAEKCGMERGLQRGLERGLKQGLEQGMKKGIEEGVRSKNFEFAKKLLSKGFAYDVVRELVDYPFTDDELEQLKDKV